MANDSLVTVSLLSRNNEKIKEELAKKIDIQQDVADSGKLLGINETGMVVPVEAPDSVKVSAESDNKIETKDDGIYVAPTDLSDYAKSDDIPDVSNFVEKEDGKGLFSGSYNDLTDQPTIPSVDGFVSEEQLTETLSNYAKTEDLPSEYDDTEIKQSITDLETDLTSVEEAIATLNGTGEGSVSKTVDDALNKFATELSDDGVVNTYKELIDYADSHSSDVAEMVADIEENTTAIGELNTKVTDIETSVENVYTKDETYSRDEVDEAITNAQLGGEEVNLSEYVKSEDLETTLESYTTDEELSTALEDYTTTADADEKYVLDEEIETITAEQIEELIGLNADEITNLASLLSDQTIELGKTWSSSHIYEKLNETLDESKAYTLSELSKAIGASYKVVTSIDQMTDSKVLYLLKDADSGMYNIYVYDEDTTTAELIGSFEINLDEYLKTEDAENTFVKQTDFEPINTQVTAILDGTITVPKSSDADTVNGNTVESNVPVDAVFTDTVYDDSNVVNRLDSIDTVLANIYSDDASDIVSSYTVTNVTVGGADITSSIVISYTFKHIKIGKIHFVTISGGRKIINTTTTQYRISVTIEIPGDFFVCTELYESQGGGLTLNPSTNNYFADKCQISQIYTQSNAASSYSPDSVYQLKKVFMLVEN